MARAIFSGDAPSFGIGLDGRPRGFFVAMDFVVMAPSFGRFEGVEDQACIFIIQRQGVV